MGPSCLQRVASPSAELQRPCCLQATAATDAYRHVKVKLHKPRNDAKDREAPTVDDINHYLKDSIKTRGIRVYYIPHYG